jgi:chromosome segregation ATPase
VEGAPVTVIRNSSGPQALLNTATKTDGNFDTKQTVLGRVSSAIHGNLFPKEQNKLDELERRDERLTKENRELVEENGSLLQKVESLMMSIELKSVECHGLRAKEQLGQNNASPGQLSGDNGKLDYRLTAKLQQKIDEYENRVRTLEVQNAQLLQKTSAQDDHIQSQTAKFARELGDIRSSELIRAPRVSDSEIQGKWKALGFAVRQFNTLRSRMSSSGCLRLQKRCGTLFYATLFSNHGCGTSCAFGSLTAIRTSGPVISARTLAC